MISSELDFSHALIFLNLPVEIHEVKIDVMGVVGINPSISQDTLIMWYL